MNFNTQSMIDYIKEHEYERVCVLSIASMRSHTDGNALCSYDLNKDGNFQYWKYQAAALKDVKFSIACPAYESYPKGFSPNVSFFIWASLYGNNAAATRSTIADRLKSVRHIFSESQEKTLYISEFETVEADVYKLNFQKHLKDEFFANILSRALSSGKHVFLHNEPTGWHEGASQSLSKYSSNVHIDKQVVNTDVFFSEVDQLVFSKTEGFLFFPFRVNEPSYKFEEIVMQCEQVSDTAFRFNGKLYNTLLMTNPNDYDISLLPDRVRRQLSFLPTTVMKMDRTTLFSFLANVNCNVYIAQHPDVEFHQLAVEASLLAPSKTFFFKDGKWLRDGDAVASKYSY